MYVDDIPSPKDCLYAAFVYSKKPMVLVKGIDFKSTPESGNIISIITINDIPDKGINIASGYLFGKEPLFPDPLIQFAGEPLAIVVIINISFFSIQFDHFVTFLKIIKWIVSSHIRLPKLKN